MTSTDSGSPVGDDAIEGDGDLAAQPASRSAMLRIKRRNISLVRQTGAMADVYFINPKKVAYLYPHIRQLCLKLCAEPQSELSRDVAPLIAPLIAREVEPERPVSRWVHRNQRK